MQMPSAGGARIALLRGPHGNVPRASGRNGEGGDRLARQDRQTPAIGRRRQRLSCAASGPAMAYLRFITGQRVETAIGSVAAKIRTGCNDFLETGNPFSPQASDRVYVLYRCRYRGAVMTYQDLSPWVYEYDAEPMHEIRERGLTIRRRIRRKRLFLLAVDIVLFCSLAAMTAHGLGLVTL